MLKHVDLSACEPLSDFISEGVFAGSGLESIILPRTLKVIRESTFNGC